MLTFTKVVACYTSSNFCFWRFWSVVQNFGDRDGQTSVDRHPHELPGALTLWSASPRANQRRHPRAPQQRHLAWTSRIDGPPVPSTLALLLHASTLDKTTTAPGFAARRTTSATRRAAPPCARHVTLAGQLATQRPSLRGEASSQTLPPCARTAELLPCPPWPPLLRRRGAPHPEPPLALLSPLPPSQEPTAASPAAIPPPVPASSPE